MTALAITALHLVFMHPETGWNGDDYAGYVRNGTALAYGLPYHMKNYIENPLMDAGLGAYPPLFPALLALPIRLFGEDFTILTGFTILLWGAASYAFMRYASPITGRAGAMAAALIVGAGPFAWFWRDSVVSEFPFQLMLFLAFLAERRFARSGSNAATAGLAVAIAACVLTRAVGAAIIPAILLADVARTRRLRPRVWAAALAAILLVAAAMALADSDSLLKYVHLVEVNSALQARNGGLAPLTFADRAGLLLANIGEFPGKLSMAWSYGTQFSPLKSGPAGSIARGGTAILLALGLAGLVWRAWRAPSAAEGFFLFETLGLLVMPRILITNRLFLPLSALLVMYALAAARRLSRAAALATFLLFASVAGFAYSGLLTIPANADTVDVPPARELFAWARANTPEDTIFLTRSPRAFIFFSGRGAADFHLAHGDAAFLAWARSLHARYLILNTGMPELRTFGIADMNLALTAYAEGFFPPGHPGFTPVFRNGWFWVWRIDGPD